MRIVHISDTHCHQVKDLPEADLLVHSGDVGIYGGPIELRSFNDWLERIKHKYQKIIYVPGNHDSLFDGAMESFAREIVTVPTILIDQPFEFMGYKFWGSPWTPAFNKWSFMRDRGPEIAYKWSHIPDDTQVLITHGPPYKTLDAIFSEDISENINVGCEDLANRISELKSLILHLFGHVHPAYGEFDFMGVKYSNASIMGYHGVNAPRVIEI